jgi:hypothetical protein
VIEVAVMSANWKITVVDASTKVVDELKGVDPKNAQVTWHNNGKFSVIWDSSVATGTTEWTFAVANSNADLKKILDDLKEKSHVAKVCANDSFRVFYPK